MTYPGHSRERVRESNRWRWLWLLAWMNAWRAVFAGRVARQLCRRPEPRWTWRRLCRLAASQTVLGGTKLALLPLAACVTLPLAWTVEFLPVCRGVGGPRGTGVAASDCQGAQAGEPGTAPGRGILLILDCAVSRAGAQPRDRAGDSAAIGPHPHRLRIRFQPERNVLRKHSLFWLAALAAAWLSSIRSLMAGPLLRACFQVGIAKDWERFRAALIAWLPA